MIFGYVSVGEGGDIWVCVSRRGGGTQAAARYIHDYLYSVKLVTVYYAVDYSRLWLPLWLAKTNKTQK